LYFSRLFLKLADYSGEILYFSRPFLKLADYSAKIMLIYNWGQSTQIKEFVMDTMVT